MASSLNRDLSAASTNAADASRSAVSWASVLAGAAVALATTLFDASMPAVVQAQAPVLLLDKVVEPSLCDKLIDHWRRGDKRMDSVASAAAASSASADTKRRIDVPVDDAKLFMPLRDCLVRRVMPARCHRLDAGAGIARRWSYSAAASWCTPVDPARVCAELPSLTTSNSRRPSCNLFSISFINSRTYSNSYVLADTWASPRSSSRKQDCS